MNSDYSLVTDSRLSYYVSTLNIKDDSNTLILSPVHHYYYNIDEIKDVRTLIHTKELNKVSDLKRFMNNTLHVLSKDSMFIGCFRDNKIRQNIFYRNRVFYWFNNILDGNAIYRYMSRTMVIKMFMKLKLEIIDMSEVDGITYFCVKKP
jgi:hypothetical protein